MPVLKRVVVACVCLAVLCLLIVLAPLAWAIVIAALFVAFCYWLASCRRRAAPLRAFPTPAGPYPTLDFAFARIDLDQFGCPGKFQMQLLAPYSVGATADKATQDEYYMSAAALKALSFGAGIPLQCVAWLIYGILLIILGGHRHPDSQVKKGRGSQEQGANLQDHGPAQEPDLDVGNHKWGFSLLTALLCGNSESPGANGKNKLPLVVFSHGIYGNMQWYTQLCREFASYGFVVVALEHQDGSAAATLDIPYVHPPKELIHTDREAVRNFRKPFLQRREKELTALIRYIQEAPSDQLPPILRAADPNCTILVGHSLGAAGVVRAVKSSTLLRDVTKMLVLYDTWAFPLSDDDVVPRSLPAICILSEDWHQKSAPEISHTLGHHSEAWFLPNTHHMFWSDPVWQFPIGKNVFSKMKDPRPAHSAMVAKTYAALDKFFGKATPQPEHPSSAIVELQLPLRAEEHPSQV